MCQLWSTTEQILLVSVVTKPSRGKRKVGKVGSKGNSLKVMFRVAQTLVEQGITGWL